MKVENFQEAEKYKLYFPILLTFSLTLIGYGVFGNDRFGFYYSLAGLLIFAFYLFLLFKKPMFFYCETTSKGVKVRFYNPHPGFRKPKAFEIPLSNFDGYEITESLGGYRRDIIFKIKKGKSVGAYPPVSISLLKENQLTELKRELDYILKIKKLK